MRILVGMSGGVDSTFAAYKLLNLPLVFLLKLLHFCRVPQQLMDDAEDYYHSFQSAPQEN